MEKEKQLLTPLASDEPLSREEFLKAIIAAGILANPNIQPKSWLGEKWGHLGICQISWFKRSVDRAYGVLFEETDPFKEVDSSESISDFQDED